MKKLVALALVALVGSTQATGPVQKVRQFRQAHERELLAEFEQLVAIPNVAADTAGLRRTAQFIQGMMRRRGIATAAAGRAHAGRAAGGVWRSARAGRYPHRHFLRPLRRPAREPRAVARRPAALPARSWPPARSTGAGSRRQLPAAGQPLSPDWRLYARSASDDKAGVMAILTGYEALRASKLKPKVNIKFFFEGEEERGSPHLAEILASHKARLASDVWVICDGPVHQSGRKQVVFGARGDVNMRLRCTARAGRCTAATTATGPPTPPWPWPACWPRWTTAPAGCAWPASTTT